jgi:hypothetical protein
LYHDSTKTARENPGRLYLLYLGALAAAGTASGGGGLLLSSRWGAALLGDSLLGTSFVCICHFDTSFLCTFILVHTN